MYDIISLILILLALYLVYKNFNLGIMIFVVAVIFLYYLKRGNISVLL